MKKFTSVKSFPMCYFTSLGYLIFVALIWGKLLCVKLNLMLSSIGPRRTTAPTTTVLRRCVV
ncbi:hypothetical protein Golob_019468, partial [Gossypium lobatum]|nr:hypothetical protein [Gossypium lobatum]